MGLNTGSRLVCNSRIVLRRTLANGGVVGTHQRREGAEPALSSEPVAISADSDNPRHPSSSGSRKRR